jgi:hypothetical protein
MHVDAKWKHQTRIGWISAIESRNMTLVQDEGMPREEST